MHTQKATQVYRILFVLALLVTLALSIGSHQRFSSAIAPSPQPLPEASTPTTLIATESGDKTIASSDRLAPLLNNLGNYHHPISTTAPLAQRYFNQGLILSYGFNLTEAERSFQEAARLDPKCAMCYWGVALALGPNINTTMKAEAVPKAWTALQKAIELSNNASKNEQAYIQALAKRYSSEPVEDRSTLNLAYVNAMRDVVQRYPDDLDAATLFAQAIMDTMPWSYWTKEGKPKPGTLELLATLESVLKRSSNHPGANHFYIHTLENKQPELAVAAADRLVNLVPGAGHLLHMPSHIYIQVGRYHDAVVVNQRAVGTDDDYVAQYLAQGFPRIDYNVGHNRNFLWFAAMMAGESKVAIEAAQHTARLAEPKLMRESWGGTLQQYYTFPLFAFAKFGMWDKVLAQPAPDADLLYPTGVWHYARGMAFTAKNQLKKAAQELEQLKSIATNPAPEKATIGEINRKILKTASEVLAGELAAKQGKYELAIAHLKTAVGLDEELHGEPALWYSPVRQTLGAVLLEAGQPAKAEQIYREDLNKYPNNGWSLQGLAQSLQAQGKTREAKEVQKQFKKAWKYADVKLTASRF
ncbi:MAG: tetratricopeptide repeat protein [Cyanobacteriota bacterium]